MEEKKNNALEKAEQIAKRNTIGNFDENNKEKQIELEQARERRAREVAHQKAEKQKAKATALREKHRRKAQLKAQKMQLQAERKKAREILKSENEEQRQRRKRIEKQAKRDHVLAVRMEKSRQRSIREQEKLAKRREKARIKRQKAKENNGRTGWLVAVISLGIATLVLASVLTFTLLMPSINDNMLEANYQKSFYDTVQQIDNIDLNLSKALATKDTGALQKYLVNTAINSELAENDIQQLPLQDQSKYYTTKLINQIGDFAKYLNNKLIDGQRLNNEDLSALSNLYRANLELKQALQNTVNTMGQDYAFSSMLSGGQGDVVVDNFNQLQNLSVQYPELIYDGPFSDGQNQREIKGLNGAQISKEQAVIQFEKIFSAMQLENIKDDGQGSGDIECFNVQGQKDGDILYAQISKQGGKLIMFSYAGSCEETRIDDDTAIEKAQEFLSTLSIENMKPVWINLANNVYTINFACEQNGVILYPDLIKVRVCAQTAIVIGLEAKSYYSNHVERVLNKPKINEQQAKKNLSENIDVDSVRLALVPIGTKTETLCYEFFGTYDNSTYYIYIDAITGKQVEMFKVVEGTEGMLLV